MSKIGRTPPIERSERRIHYARKLCQNFRTISRLMLLSGNDTNNITYTWMEMNASTSTGDIEAAIINDEVKAAATAHYDYYSMFSVLTLGYMALPIEIFGVIANCFSIRIFTTKYMIHSPINWYLTVLSISDLMILLTSFLFLTSARLSQDAEQWYAIHISYFLTPYLYAWSRTVQTISVYMTVMMSAHRFIGVCFPFKASHILSKKRVKILIASTILFALLYNSLRWFEVTHDRIAFQVNINYSLWKLRPTALRVNLLYQKIDYPIYTLIMFILPFTSLIFMNTAVIKAVHSTRQRHMTLGGDDAQKKSEMLKEIRTSIMLVGIVLIFLVCNVMGMIVNLIELLDFLILDYHFAKNYGDWFAILVDINNLLVIVNASANIAVYCLFSDKYRYLLKYHFMCYCCREGEALLPSSVMTQLQ